MIWELLEQIVYQDRRITDLDSLKEAIVEEWNKIRLEIDNKCIDAFKPRLQRAIEVEDRLIDWYWLLIIHIDTSQYVFANFDMILIN